jgi:PIN domain
MRPVVVDAERVAGGVADHARPGVGVDQPVGAPRGRPPEQLTMEPRQRLGVRRPNLEVRDRVPHPTPPLKGAFSQETGRSLICYEPALLRALEVYEVHRLDFADAYLVAEAETSGVNAVASFDKAIERVPTVRRIEP